MSKDSDEEAVHRSNDDPRPLRDFLDDSSAKSGISSAGSSGVVRSGFLDMDDLLGFHRQDLVILAARPSVGKSSLLLNFARNAAVGQHARVAIFSIQMPGQSLAHRLLAAESGVDVSRLRLGIRTEIEERNLMYATEVLCDQHIYIDQSSMVTVPQMHAKLRRLKHQISGLELVLIDSLELMDARSRYGGERVSGVSESNLKALARELDVPIVVTAGLSSTREPHMPMLSDLRESGIVEQDADVVMFLYREDIYTTREEWERRNFDTPYPQGITKVIVAKHRNGPTGIVHLRFQNHLSRFEELMVVEEESA